MLPAKLRSPLKWLMWIIVLQLLLGNISAALYAYRLTHFKAEAAEWNIAEANNVFDKTWMLFTGPQYARDTVENHPVFPVRDVTFKTAKGLLIHAWYSTVAGARGTVCLFHGLNSNKAYYEPEAAAFRSYGFNVLMVDFRAHGISEGMQSTIGYDEAEEVMLAFRFARNQGAGLVFLFGGSMGAVTIARAVSHYRLNPDGIILDMPFDGLVDHVRARGGTFGFP
ncbi:MAG TPA: alpha/beta fold hydrolase, partial [Flavisolibacter sp.]